jgi:hypothetical protein
VRAQEALKSQANALFGSQGKPYHLKLCSLGAFFSSDEHRYHDMWVVSLPREGTKKVAGSAATFSAPATS